MPKYTDENRQKHVALVRQAMAMRPRASIYVIHDALQKSGHKLTHKYIWKLRQKIIDDRRRRYNDADVMVKIAEIQDKLEQVQEQLWAVIANPAAELDTKVRACKVLMENELKLFESQMDAGIFERKLGEFGVRHQIDVPPEQRAEIVSAMVNLGLIKPKKIIEVEASNIKTQTENENGSGYTSTG